ncbi:hypothetical protein BB561_006483 [Smittium simulii]|uniref:Peptidase S1 domain-containing protein n=1 Tax=Smittium simulii TaxID=133385 RepID=A0A2T9Y3S8_9FUNG|nr:hypothetical protein BB561_006483 [Smittium simulii]
MANDLSPESTYKSVKYCKKLDKHEENYLNKYTINSNELFVLVSNAQHLLHPLLTISKPENQTLNFSSLFSADPLSNSHNKELSKRITNGKTAKISEFPYASFLLIDFGVGGAFCGGSLIAPNIIISAAHCFINPVDGKAVHPSRISAKLGSERITKEPTTTFKVKYLANHQKFSPVRYSDDIALLFLEKDVPANIAAPVEIYTENISDDLAVRAAGWGTTTKSNIVGTKIGFSLTLNYLDITIRSDNLCMSPEYSWTNNNDKSICSINKSNSGVCMGDSGGPLSTNVGNSTKLVGISSAIAISVSDSGEAKCGRKNEGAFFTHVNYYSNWIEQQIDAFKNNSISIEADTNSKYFFSYYDFIQSKGSKPGQDFYINFSSYSVRIGTNLILLSIR